MPAIQTGGAIKGNGGPFTASDMEAAFLDTLVLRGGALTQYSLTRVGADGKTLQDSAFSDTGSFAIIDRELRVRPGGVGGERLRVAAAGVSLGLVTESPAAALHVRSDGVQTNLFRFALDGSNRLVGIMASNGNIYQVLTGTSPTFRFGQAMAIGGDFTPSAMLESRSTTLAQFLASYDGTRGLTLTVNSTPNAIWNITSALGGYFWYINSGAGLTLTPSALTSSKPFVSPTKTPASASAAGIAGEWAWDTSYIYICIATNTWRRIAHATW